MQAGLTTTAAAAAGESGAVGASGAFITKQTPLDAREGHVDVVPREALGGSPRPPVHELQPESDGPEVLMGPLRQADPEERMAAIADAQADTDIAAAKAHAEAVKGHRHHD